MRFYTIENTQLSIGASVFHRTADGRSLTSVVMDMQEKRGLSGDENIVFINRHNGLVSVVGNLVDVNRQIAHGHRGIIVSAFYPLVVALDIGDTIELRSDGYIHTYTSTGDGVTGSCEPVY